MTYDDEARTLYRYDDAEGADRLSWGGPLSGDRRAERPRRVVLAGVAFMAVGALAAAPMLSPDFLRPSGIAAIEPVAPAGRSGTTETARPSPSHSTSPRRQLAAGQKIVVPGGDQLWLTRTGYCHRSADEMYEGQKVAGITTCRRVDDGNVGRGVGLQGGGNAQGSLSSGLWRGKGKPATVLVRSDRGGVKTATILTHPAQKGWIAYYVWELRADRPAPSTAVPAAPVPTTTPSHAGFLVRVLDARGKVLDQLG